MPFYCWAVRVLYIFWILNTLKYMIYDYFTHSVSFLFTFLSIMSFNAQKFYILMKSCRQHRVGSWFIIYFTNLCLLIEEFFISLPLVISKERFSPTILLVFHLFCSLIPTLLPSFVIFFQWTILTLFIFLFL